MTGYRAGLDLSGLLRAPERCPSCVAATLVAVDDANVTNFLCLSCGDCFHVELGRISVVDPHTCTACIHQMQCLRNRTSGAGR